MRSFVPQIRHSRTDIGSFLGPGEPSISISFTPGRDHPFSLSGDPSSVARVTSYTRKTTQGRRRKQQNVSGQGYSLSYRQATTISALPDNVLLEIFFFYKEDYDQPYPVWKWHLLVHICRRWRQVVFASPLSTQSRPANFLHIRNSCQEESGNMASPSYFHSNHNNTSSENNIVTALEHIDRVCDVRLHATGSELENLFTEMQEPFPVLKSLYIVSEDGNALILPAEFLGRSAPRLQYMYLRRIPFPALPTLLLSTSDLVDLDLSNVPPTGYISPEAIVVGLAALPRLKGFVIRFQSTTHPGRIRLHPVTRTVLPAFTRLHFKGASEYLEDLVSRIDAPQLNRINISYSNQLHDFQVAQLPMFMVRSIGPKLTEFRYAQVSIFGDGVTFHTYCRANDPSGDSPAAWTTVFCQGIDWQISHIAQVLSHWHASATLSNLVHLKLDVRLDYDCQLEGTDDVEWLRLLHQFSTVQTLHVSQELAGYVSLALEGIGGETVAEALPPLDLIYLAGQPASSIEKFVAARRLSGRPVTVIDTEGEFDERVTSHVSE